MTRNINIRTQQENKKTTFGQKFVPSTFVLPIRLTWRARKSSSIGTRPPPQHKTNQSVCLLKIGPYAPTPSRCPRCCVTFFCPPALPSQSYVLVSYRRKSVARSVKVPCQKTVCEMTTHPNPAQEHAQKQLKRTKQKIVTPQEKWLVVWYQTPPCPVRSTWTRSRPSAEKTWYPNLRKT